MPKSVDEYPYVMQTDKCIVCHETSVVKLTTSEYLAMAAGKHIQNALPDRDADFRELVLTGTHPACWDKMFKDLPEDEE